MSDATMTIPAEYATAFYSEAIRTLAYAAHNLTEGADWYEEGKGLGDDRINNEDIPRMLDAISLVERARNEEHEFGAEDLVRATIEGLAIKAGERVSECAQSLCATAAMREAMTELDVWVTLLDSEPMREVARRREAKYAAIRRAKGSAA